MISSLRRDFEEYKVVTEKFDMSNDYSSCNMAASYLEADIIPNTVFVLNYSRFDDHSLLESIARQLTDFKVYTSFVHRKNFSDCEHINFVKKNSKKYFNALFTSQFIVVDSSLSAYYVPKEGQTVITTLDLAESTDLEAIARNTKNILRSSVITCSSGDVEEKFKKLFPALTSFNGSFVKGEDIIDFIRGKDCSVIKHQAENKNKILIQALFGKFEKWLPLMCNYLDHVDYATNEVTLILDSKYIDILSRFIMKYTDRINVVFRTGWFLIKEEERKLYDYFNSDLPYFNEPDKIFEYVPKEYYQRELARMVGYTHFDTMLLFSFRASNNSYWLNIARAMDIKNKHLIFDKTMYNNVLKDPDLIMEYNKHVTSLYLSIENIWFWNNTQMEEFNQMVEEYGLDASEHNMSVMSLLPAKNLNYETVLIDYNREKYIVYNEYSTVGLRLNIVKAPVNADNTYAIVLEGSSEYLNGNVDVLKSYIHNNKDKEFIIFDIDHVAVSALTSIMDEETNVTLWQGAMYYYVYLNYLNNYIVSPDSVARVQELKTLNKNIIDELR